MSTSDRSWTRGQVATLADAQASRLEASGAVRNGPGTLLALVSQTSPEFISAFLACRRAGARVLLIDGETPRNQAVHIADELGAAAIWQPTRHESSPQVLPGVEVLRGDSLYPATAVVRLTSGTSNSPVGVAMTADALAADSLALERSMGLRETDRFLVSVPLSHAYGFSVLACAVIHRLGALVFPAGPSGLHAAAREHGVTVWPSVPSWFEASSRIAPSVEPLPESVRLMLSAGAPLRPSTASRWRLLHQQGIHVLYGSSECGAICYDRSGTAAERGTVGTPVDGVRISLGEDGVVAVSSDAVGSCYVPAPFDRGSRIQAGVFHSEDLAEFQGEELKLLGRASEWVNVKGRKVNPREVEHVIACMPGVDDVVVTRRILPAGKGEGLRAFIVTSDSAIGFREITAWCRARLPPHMIPRSIRWVPEVPRTPRGKVDSRALPCE